MFDYRGLRETEKKRLGCSAPIFAPRCDKYTPEDGCVLGKYCFYQFEERKIMGER